MHDQCGRNGMEKDDEAKKHITKNSDSKTQKGFLGSA